MSDETRTRTAQVGRMEASEAAASTLNDRQATAGRHLPTLARITLIYESRDKRFCLFEDAQGHITAVRASRFA